MTTGEMWGWIGGITGSLLGIAGGIIGSYFSIKSTNGPRERAFIKYYIAVCLVFILAFLGLQYYLPHPYKSFLWLPYALVLGFGIRYGNKKQQQIRADESAEQGGPGYPPQGVGSPDP